jgi:hypothetical protein
LTKQINAKSFALEKEQVNSSCAVNKNTERDGDLIYKQQKTNDAKYPYEGPALISKYGQTLDNISSQLEPKEVLIDPTAGAKSVNYYHVTSNPGAYTDSVHKAPVKDKNIEKYADYNYINDTVQSHVYKDYDPFDYNSVHTGNDYVCLTRRGNINSADHSVYYDPDQVDALPKKVNDYTRSDRVGNIESATRVGDNIYGENSGNKDTIRYSYAVNGRDPTATARYTDIAQRSAEMTKLHRETYDINTRESHANSGSNRNNMDVSEMKSTRMGANANEYTANSRDQIGSKASAGDGAYNLMKVDIHKNKRNGSLAPNYVGTAGGSSCAKGTTANAAKNIVRKNNEYVGRMTGGQGNTFSDTIVGKDDNNKRELVYTKAEQTVFNRKNVAPSVIDERLNSIFNSKGKQKLCNRESVMIEAPTF